MSVCVIVFADGGNIVLYQPLRLSRAHSSNYYYYIIITIMIMSSRVWKLRIKTKLLLVNGVVQWLGRRSAASGLSLICA